jgi:hypothetical protein
MGKIAFLNNKLIWAGGDEPPNFLDSEGELETEVVIAKYADTFDPKYEYSYEEIEEEYEVTPAIAEVRDDEGNVTTEAVPAVMGKRVEFYAKQGDLVVVDPVEEERIFNEEQAIKYREERQPEYPSVGDQLDALYHAGIFPDDLASEIKAVKDKYPKPE